MLKLITTDENEAYLRQKSKDVDFDGDSTYLSEIEELKRFLEENPIGFALASIQLGIAKKIIVIKSTSEDASSNDEMVLINPKIISMRGKTLFYEACFSCGLCNMGLVERPYQIEVEYCDINGVKKINVFEGFVATVISHEIDHLEGIFHLDRAKEIQIIEYDQRTSFRKEHPYTIISKNCEFKYDDIGIGGKQNE